MLWEGLESGSFRGCAGGEPDLGSGLVRLVGRDGPVSMCPLNMAGGRVCPFSLLPPLTCPFISPTLFLCEQLSSLLLSLLFTAALSILPVAGPHFPSIVTLRAGYLRFQSYNVVLYPPDYVIQRYPAFFSEEETTLPHWLSNSSVGRV